MGYKVLVYAQIRDVKLPPESGNARGKIDIRADQGDLSIEFPIEMRDLLERRGDIGNIDQLRGRLIQIVLP